MIALLRNSPPALPATVPEPLVAWIMKLLAKSADDRYATAEEALAALRATAPAST